MYIIILLLFVYLQRDFCSACPPCPWFGLLIPWSCRGGLAGRATTTGPGGWLAGRAATTGPWGGLGGCATTVGPALLSPPVALGFPGTAMTSSARPAALPSNGRGVSMSPLRPPPPPRRVKSVLALRMFYLLITSAARCTGMYVKYIEDDIYA